MSEIRKTEVRKSITNECCYTCEHWKSEDGYDANCQIIEKKEGTMASYTEWDGVCDLYERRK